MTRRRLDTELVRRGLATGKAEAREAVLAGLITVGGAPATNAAMMVAADQPVALRAPARRFVSRGGEKLRAALERFGLDPAGAVCLDAGASTGGFTDCLLQAGASRVVAVDVAYGQLAWELRTDDRVTVMERCNVRDLTPADLPFSPVFLVADLSFMSLRTVLPALVSVAAPGATFVALVKPQFEAGPGDVGQGGVVRDPEVWRRVLLEVTLSASTSGLTVRGIMASPITGPAGNVEFFLHAVVNGAPGIDVESIVSSAVDAGLELRG